MAKTGKPQTYNDIIAALVTQPVAMPARLLENIDATINANKQLGSATREEFIEDAVIAMLQNLSSKLGQENSAKESQTKKTE